MLILAMLAIIMLLAGCQSAPPEQPDPDTPVSSDDTPVSPVPEEPNEETHIIAEISMIDSLDALILESWPLQVNAVVSGNLPDGCTTIHRVESEREENVFHLKVFTIREKEALCTQALVPFEEVIPLDVYGLPAGTYTIEAYGLSTEFTFDSDNILEKPSSRG